MRFTTHSEDEIDADLRKEGVNRMEVIEGLYGGLLEIHATRTHGVWDLLAVWDDGRTDDMALFEPVPGLN